MVAILLILIYMAFISLGLPDCLLGVAWPSIQTEWGLTLDAAGLVSMFITCGTIVSGFLSGYFIRKISTGKIVFISCAMTGVSLLGFSIAPSYIWLLLFSIPLGLGAGTVDASLNNYVALHFKAHHMNWLHSFWGFGATIGPVIMGQALSSALSWRGGYRIVSVIQLSLAVLLAISLPLWKKFDAVKGSQVEKKDEKQVKHKIIDKDIFKKIGLKYALATFTFYCAIELSVGLWGSSFLVKAKDISVDIAAYWVALYYASITVGRFISGFISFKVSNKQMIRFGGAIALIGTLLMVMPLPKSISIIPFILIGLGLSPIFPAMIHETPKRFDKKSSQDIIGYQMAFAYIGSAFFPPLFGVIIDNISIIMLPIMLIICALILIFCTERLNRLIKGNEE